MHQCKWGCVDGACLEWDPCGEHSCSEPPAPYCQVGGVVTAQGDGHCFVTDDGQAACEYDTDWAPCGEGEVCDVGQCVPDPDAAADCVPFEAVLSVFQVNNCTGCHGASGGLNLGTYQNVMAGGTHGSTVVPHLPDESALYLKLHSDTVPFGSRMPLGAPGMSAEERQVIYAWIDSGAHEHCGP